MNNEIQRFEFKGASLRALTDEAGEPWFVAKDACDILGNDTNHLREALDDDEITNLRNSEVWNQPGRAPLIISEPGLYKLIMRSRKPEAKEFQRWVTHEVLPSIRKHGAYMTQQTLDKALTSPDFLIQLGEHELRQWLVDNGWIYRQPNQSWCAASSRVRQGYMVMVSSRSHGIHKDGTPFAYPPTPKLTRKGLALIHQRLSEQSFERVLDAEVAA